MVRKFVFLFLASNQYLPVGVQLKSTVKDKRNNLQTLMKKHEKTASAGAQNFPKLRF